VPRPLAVLLLLLTAMIWGLAFTAQKSGMATMGPLTFLGVRFLMGGILLLPLAFWEYGRRAAPVTRRQRLLIALLAVVFFFGAWLQQAGLALTTVTNGGFLTGLYVIFAPLIGLAFLRHKPHPIVWLCAPLTLVGIYFLNGGSLTRFNTGDVIVIVSALFWAVQIMLLSYLARLTGLPVLISALCFLVSGVIAAVGAASFEAPTIAGIGAGWLPLLYTGILSTAVAFTFQAIGQQYVPPANATIILSAETLFAALGGALILGERLPVIGYVGAILLFVAIILVEVVPALDRREPIPVTETS
jgi:drug/metabolite transporter (DMT)-like permease